MDANVRHARTIGKIVIVVVALVLVWTTYHKPTRPLTPLEQKVEEELHSTSVPDRYSDGAWSVQGVLAKKDIVSGDAFMVRGVVQLAANLNSRPDQWYLTLADRRTDKDSMTVLIRKEEASIFKEGGHVAIQIRYIVDPVNQSGEAVAGHFETF